MTPKTWYNILVMSKKKIGIEIRLSSDKFFFILISNHRPTVCRSSVGKVSLDYR